MARRGTELEFLGCSSGCYGLGGFSSLALMENNHAQQENEVGSNIPAKPPFCHCAIGVRILSRGVHETGLKC